MRCILYTCIFFLRGGFLGLTILYHGMFDIRVRRTHRIVHYQLDSLLFGMPTGDPFVKSPILYYFLQLKSQPKNLRGDDFYFDIPISLPSGGDFNVKSDTLFRTVDNVRTIIQRQNEYIYIPDLRTYPIPLLI